MPIVHNGPIGIFDSGIGGLSVLLHIRRQLPHEHLLYFADAGFAPYGGRPEQEVVARSVAIAAFLLQQGAKALVVACNTATAAAIAALRAQYPSLPVVGVEPGLKPAATITSSGIVGVLATERTLSSSKFDLLRQQVTAATNVRFVTKACIGLADQIEKGELQSAATAALLTRYVAPLLQEGADTLVLGCTHYPFVQPLIEEIIRHHSDSPVRIVDTGDAVARQLGRLLTQHACALDDGEGMLQAYTSGSKTSLASAFARLLNTHPPITQIEAQAG